MTYLYITINMYYIHFCVSNFHNLYNFVLHLLRFQLRGRNNVNLI